MISSPPDFVTRTTRPVPGVGNGFPVVFSRTYILPQSSNATPSTVVRPRATIRTCPPGLIR